MKYLTTLLLFALLAFGGTSCESNDDRIGGGGTCDDAFEEFTTAIAAWGQDNSEENCEAYKASLLRIINKCNLEDLYDQYGGQTSWEELVLAIEELNCMP